jgi:heme-degrading monooxygenase HmoA
MIIRMSMWSAQPGTDDESQRLWRELVGPIWYRQPGLIQAHILRDRTSQRRMTFSVWSSAEAYETFLQGEDLRTVATAYDHIYLSAEHRPEAVEWDVLTEDWLEAGHSLPGGTK